MGRDAEAGIGMDVSRARRLVARNNLLWADGGKDGADVLGDSSGVLAVPLAVFRGKGQSWSVVIEVRGRSELYEVAVAGPAARELFGKILSRRFDEDQAPLWSQQWRVVASASRIVWTLGRGDAAFVMPDEAILLRDLSALIVRSRSKAAAEKNGAPAGSDPAAPVQTSAPAAPSP